MAKAKRFFIRLDEDEFEKFKIKSLEYGKDHSDLIRELMCAVNDGRVQITPTDEQHKTLTMTRGLYNVTRK